MEEWRESEGGGMVKAMEHLCRGGGEGRDLERWKGWRACIQTMGDGD